jgi:hypothetical protein
MKYQQGMELICIKTLKRKRGATKGQIDFIKGNKYIVEDIFQKEYAPAMNPISIVLKNEHGELQPIAGMNKTKYFKIPRPEGVPVTPPPPPKSKAEKLATRNEKRLEKQNQAKEWKKIKKLKVKDKNKKIIRRASGF